MQQQFKGTGVAVVTPFDTNGDIDFPALGNIIEHLILGEVDYLVALGTTGESVTLSNEEQILIIRYFIDKLQNRLPLIIGAGGNDTKKVIKFIAEINALNYQGILSVSPYYNKPSQNAIYAHYKAIAESTDKAIILYNVPSRTGSNIEVETTVLLANDFSNIVAIKEASGDLQQITNIIANKPNNFLVLSGDDSIVLPIIAIGGKGLISVAANAFPNEFSSIVNKALNNNWNGARSIFYKMHNSIELLFSEGNPTGIKAYLNELGLCENELRLPLIKASETLLNQIKHNLKQLS